jgi:hypothetical protein
VPQAIRESAERLLSTKDGIFDRSGGRALAKKITDGLLIDIQEAVNGAADAATPILSGLGRKRLMVWVVIDVVRSPVVLDRMAADKAGGRIWLQAQRVSAALIAIADGAAKECAAARAAAAADPNLEAGLATKLAAVDAAEKLKVSELRGEVYIGFHELEIASPPQLPLVSGAGIDEASLGPHAATHTSSSSSGIRYPYLVPTTCTSGEAPAIPADLRHKLGVDGCNLLERKYARWMEAHDPEHWWSCSLPMLCLSLMDQLACAEADVAVRDRELQEATDARNSATADLLSCECENDELREKLKLSEARVEVLSEVLSRKNA